LRGIARLAAYTAARGAQAGYVRSVGTELARDNIQMNLIAQNWVESDVYYPESLQENPKFQANLKREVPLGRLARAEEDCALALFLAGNDSDFFVGQVIPFAGGWAGRGCIHGRSGVSTWAPQPGPIADASRDRSFYADTPFSGSLGGLDRGCQRQFGHGCRFHFAVGHYLFRGNGQFPPVGGIRHRQPR
jgi:hypothetical protein